MLAPRASADMANSTCRTWGSGAVPVPRQRAGGGLRARLHVRRADAARVERRPSSHRTFSDGTTLEYDRKAHKLTASVKGDVEASVTGNVEVTLQGSGKVTAGGALELTSAAKIGLNTPALSMGGSGGGGTEAATQGNIRHRGNITVTGGDVTVNGISFLSHVHDCPHGGATGVPR